MITQKIIDEHARIIANHNTYVFEQLWKEKHISKWTNDDWKKASEAYEPDFRSDVVPFELMREYKMDTDDWNIDDWKRICPEYGFRHMSGLYCDHCSMLYNNERKLCPNNH